MKPTQETYTAFQRAYDFFNRELFGAALPDCLITLQRKDKRTYGYFSGERFGQLSGMGRTDEIAYHNREWAAKMNQLAHQCIKMNHVNQRTNLWLPEASGSLLILLVHHFSDP